jgi:hypothetical protein
MAWEASTKIPAYYEFGQPKADDEFRWQLAGRRPGRNRAWATLSRASRASR